MKNSIFVTTETSSREKKSVANPDPEVRSSGTVHSAFR